MKLNTVRILYTCMFFLKIEGFEGGSSCTQGVGVQLNMVLSMDTSDF